LNDLVVDGVLLASSWRLDAESLLGNVRLIESNWKMPAGFRAGQ